MGLGATRRQRSAGTPGQRSTGTPRQRSAGTPGFTAAVSAITDAFGDPTRRRIYLFVRDHARDSADDLPSASRVDGTRSDANEGVTASAVAVEVGVHPNVARHHLDKLAAGGYVEVVARSTVEPGRKAGRPSKRYVAIGVVGSADVPVRSDDLVLALLGQALTRLPRAEAEAMAEEVGATYGRALASGFTGASVASGQRSLRSAMRAVADALTAHGFASRTTDAGGRGEQLRIINDHCPFGSVAIDNPVICAVDRGLVRGMLGVLYTSVDDLDVSTQSSRAHGDTFCATGV